MYGGYRWLRVGYTWLIIRGYGRLCVQPNPPSGWQHQLWPAGICSWSPRSEYPGQTYEPGERRGGEGRYGYGFLMYMYTKDDFNYPFFDKKKVG